jgi:capsid portal protein
MCAVVFAPDRKTLERSIREYMLELDEHVTEARRKLDALPADWTGEREVQERLISALAMLAAITRA